MIAPQTRGYRASKRNPCPVCGGESWCRELPDEWVQCARESGEKTPGYRRVKELSNGQGFLYRPEGDKVAQLPPRKAVGFGQTEQIGAVGRNAAYRHLVAELPLSDKHRAYLDDRGIPAEMAYESGWRSLDPSQPLTNDYPDDLAGIVRRGGRQYLNGAAGILNPARDPLDRILGFQIRKDNTEAGRYSWLSSKSDRYPDRPGPQLPSGELPIACYPGTDTERPWLVEGTGPKPFIVSLQTGQTVIGAAGGHFPEAILGEYLQALRPAVIVIAPDAGCLENEHVARRTMATIRQVQALGYSVQIAWWGQASKTDSLDADDLFLAGRSGEIRFIDSAEYESLHSPELLAKIAPSTPKGLFKVSGRVAPIDLATLKLTSTYSQAGRLDAWQRTKTRYVIDVSPTGSGKTTDAGKLSPADFECDQLLYLTNDPRNPSTETLEDWAYLDGRHAGLALDESRHLRRAAENTPPEDLDESANCARTAVADAIRRKRVETESICSSCEHRFNCHGGTGLYQYLNSRIKDLKAPRLRAHPQAIRPTDLSGTVALIIEEAEALASTETVSVTSNERTKLRQRLLANRPDLCAKLAPLLDGLDELAGLATGYGFETRNTRDHLKGFAVDLTLEEADALSGGRVESLDPELGRYVSDSYVTEEVDTSLRLNWIPDLLDVLKGFHGGLQVLSNGTLQITLAPSHIRRLIKHPSVKKVIFLTATADRTLLDALDLDQSELTICTEKATAKPPKRVQILGLGNLTPKTQRSEKITEAIDLTIDQLRERHGGNIAVIDFKRHLASHADKAGAWWRDSRGSNTMANTQALIIVGSPVPHIGQIAANYAALTGRAPDPSTTIRPYPVAQAGAETWMHGLEEFKDPELARYLHQKIAAEMLQAEGRIRANRRQDEALTVYYLTDRPTGLEVPSVEHARDLISVEVGRDASQKALDEANAQARDRTREAMIQAVNQHGADLSCRKLASIARVNKDTAAAFLKALREADLLEESLSGSDPLYIETIGAGQAISAESSNPVRVCPPPLPPEVQEYPQTAHTEAPPPPQSHWTPPDWWQTSGDPIADMCARAAAALQSQQRRQA